MFPESFVAEQLLAYSRPDDLVYDPFCGRGTTILEGLLNDRDVIGSDVNLVAACVAGAKAEVPELSTVLRRVDELQSTFHDLGDKDLPESDFFAACYHPKTFSEISYLRSNLQWQENPVDRFIAATMLGVLHGESHRSEMCLSNRMPRTISTKPDYSVRWWASRDLVAPERDTFAILRQSLGFRYSMKPPVRTGKVRLADSRTASTIFHEEKGRVSLVVTSPPYLDTTDYAEDQWLRLWFLGQGIRPQTRQNKDDRHTSIENYWTFLSEVWGGMEGLLAEKSTVVIRIGGTRLEKTALMDGLFSGISQAMPNRKVVAIHDGKSSIIAKRQTNSFRPGTSPDKMEHDFAFSIQ